MSVRYAVLLACAALHGASFTQVEVFRASEGGYHTYRIPALISTQKGTLLAFCEGRKNSASDTGNIDLLLRRSFDAGRTWGPVQVVADLGDDTIGNPAPVVDRKTGAILLLLTRNAGAVNERQINEGAAPPRTVWITRSTDDGATWSAPTDITSQTKLPDWTWYATGPGNGIQLRSGRIVVPCDHNTRNPNQRYSHVIYSDDGGATWKIGGVADPQTNESAVAEVRDGSLVLNMRSYHGRNRRAVQRSKDAGITWGPLVFDDTLIEPVCQASLIAGPKRGTMLFSNPASTKRERMTVRFSRDDGRSWAASKVMHEGPAAYSSLALLRGGEMGLLYERGDRSAYEKITFARFNLDWLRVR